MRKKIAVVFGGGGARGLAHVGVLQALQRHGIPIDIVAGTSMGSLIGAMYAQHPDADIVRTRVENFLLSPEYERLGLSNFKRKKNAEPEDLFTSVIKEVERRVVINLAAGRIALLKDNERLWAALGTLLDVADISSARLPFACVAADLISGKQYVFRNGDIRTAVMASSAIPGFLPPVSYNGALLTDGSVVNNIPITVARQMGADIIIAVDVSLEFESEAPVENVVEVVMRAAQMTGHRLNTVLVKEADVLIEPPIGRFHWTEFERFKELIDLGEKATENKMDEIRQIIKERNSFWYRLFHRGERKE